MENHLFAMIGMWEAIGILAIVILFFGAKKLPQLAQGMGQGIREFRKAASNEQDEPTKRP